MHISLHTKKKIYIYIKEQQDLYILQKNVLPACVKLTLDLTRALLWFFILFYFILGNYQNKQEQTVLK